MSAAVGASPAVAPAHLKNHSPVALIKLELERIVQASGGRKHAKLHQDCRSIIELFSALPTTSAPGTDPPSTPQLTERPDGGESSGAYTSPEGSAAGIASNPGLVDGQISEEHAWKLLGVLRLALDTRVPKVVDVVQDCLQRLVAHGHLIGSADVMQSSDPATSAGREDVREVGLPQPATPMRGETEVSGEGEQGTALAAPTPLEAASAPVPSSSVASAAPTVAAAVIDLMCRGVEVTDETIELQVLKGMLTTVSSATFQVHGEALLRVVRTCYNIYLASKSEVNQTTAKACLTQMLTVVFHRMEADSTNVQPTPIVVSQLLRPVGGEDMSNPMMQFVQTFVNKVLSDLEEALYTKATTTPWDRDGEADGEESDALDHTDPEAKSWETGSLGGMSEGSVRPAAGGGAEDGEEVYTSQQSAMLRRDAFLVFRALCKLSMKNPMDGMSDPFQARGKALSLELVKILLDNAGQVFHSSPKFIGAIKQYLCMSLLKNCSHPTPLSFQLSVAIFSTLLTKFRDSLKAEIGVFFPMMMLRVLETGSTSYQARSTALRSLQQHCKDSQLLVDLFINYDCDLESSNIFERSVNTLVKVAQRSSAGTVNEGVLTPQQEAQVQLDAMQCLVCILHSLAKWTDVPTAQAAAAMLSTTTSALESNTHPADRMAPAETSTDDPSSGVDERSGCIIPIGPGMASTGPSEATHFEQMKASKLSFQEGIALFNTKPNKGLEFLQKQGKVGTSPEDVSNFFKSNPNSMLDRSMIGEFLGEKKDFNLAVMHAYVDSMDFTSMAFDNAIRHFLAGFRLPGEAQKIDRLMEKFAERYCKNNPRKFKSADSAYVLAYSVIMLNTDAHNPQVKNKMRKDEFIRNNRGIDDGKDLNKEFMEELYDSIVNNEIRMKGGDDEKGPTKEGSLKSNLVPAQAARIGLDLLLNLLPGRRNGMGPGISEEAIRSMQIKLKEQGRGGTQYIAASASECVRPMMEVAWPPMLACFSLPMEESDDPHTVHLCLDGFKYAIHACSALGLHTLRDAFVQSLTKFTLLHTPANMQPKNIDAIRTLVTVAVEDGNNLQESWEPVLKCVSRFDLVYQLSSGLVTDATIFAAPNQTDSSTARGGSTMSSKLRSKASKAIHRLYSSKMVPNGALEEGMRKHMEVPECSGGSRQDEASSDDAAMHANAAAYAAAAGSSISGVGLEEAPPAPGVMEQIDPMEVNRMFVSSERLDSEAVVEFVRALCNVSLEELRSERPRVFSLTKIVEIAHFNMSRIRLVWTRIWVVLADYFVTVGCHPNLQIAMYAVDSLRQLAMKFLERDELANYQFQNDFLKPFVVVMRQSPNVEIRELIIRCVSQMVLARVTNIKSGWKSMFMVFTTAATDEQRSIVTLAFETIEKIVREHFSHITETETATFTDCVNCLIAFTNSHFNMDISLNAIAFLRFCALKLAEGAIGHLEMPSPSPLSTSGTTDFAADPENDVHVYFWFPLLAGLSELTFDSRPAIRKSSLEVLFDILKIHGHLFSETFWTRVFDSVLFPIFDHVRSDGLGDSGDCITDSAHGDEIDTWLYETCTHCLKFVVDLFTQFYSVVGAVLPQLLALLTGFIKRPHERLAAVGVDSLGRLLKDAGPLLKHSEWELVIASLNQAVRETHPDMYSLVGPPQQLAQRVADGAETADSHPAKTHEGKAWIRLHRKVACLTATQKVLAHQLGEIHATQGLRLSQSQVAALLQMLVQMMDHARTANRDHCLRSLIKIASEEMTQQISSSPKPVSKMSDPPLLNLELTTSQIYLTMLVQSHVHRHSGHDNMEEVDVAKVDTRLVEHIISVLQSFIEVTEEASEQMYRKASQDATAPDLLGHGTSTKQERLSGEVQVQVDARGPLVTAALVGLTKFAEPTFRQHLPELFVLLTSLIQCEAAPIEVHRTLSKVFVDRVGPILQEKLKQMPVQTEA